MALYGARSKCLRIHGVNKVRFPHITRAKPGQKADVVKARV